jgi:hypothetical protein
MTPETETKTAQQLKAERLERGISRRDLDRERERARAADPEKVRPQFWWVRK